MQNIKKHFINKRNRKALSDIVSTTLMVFISILAVLILWVIVHPLINPPSLSPQEKCLNSQLKDQISISSACYNSLSKEIELTLNRKSGESISSLQFTINSDQGSESWLCSDSCGFCEIPETGSSKKYFLSHPIPDGEVFVLADNCLIGQRKIPLC